jgi:hypothetical protein
VPRGLEEAADIPDRVVLCDAFAEFALSDAFGTEEIDLRINDDESGAVGIELHLHSRQRRLVRIALRSLMTV